MARSWAFRACVLILGGGIFLIIYFNRGAVPENYRVVRSTFKAAMAADGHIALDSGTKEKMSSTAARLRKVIRGDLKSLAGAGLVPWSTAQAIVALGEGEETNRPAYANNAISLIRGNETGGCFCWTEIPRNEADGVAMFIAGWVMLAFSDLREPVSDNDVGYILEAQNVEGWWPIFRDKTDEAFASTYSTAWIVLGLVEISRHELISSALREQAEDAIASAVQWLLRTRTPSYKWKPYPNMADSKESDSISGLVVHTLHVADPSDLRDLDQAWLSGLPSHPPEAPDKEPGTYVELRGSNKERIDHFVQFKLPWMLIATVDAYSSGSIFQKGRARNWIDVALSQDSVENADANINNWWRAELLYALNYVQRRE
jgi:hypothetical protein